VIVTNENTEQFSQMANQQLKRGLSQMISSFSGVDVFPKNYFLKSWRQTVFFTNLAEYIKLHQSFLKQLQSLFSI